MLLNTCFAASLLVASAQAATTACRCFPGDACWPVVDVWTQFNQSVDGQLVENVPLGTPCHVPNYNAEECAKLRNGWQLPKEQ
ncbi:FAD-binding type 2 [Penicillium waksmanii]|uniref:FAD-binding type 2 n=1 Tax=Penicillium waksmanii TaxID=69791 RepID=UPI0025499112|nr:FAD-binding type 2 [Penicillium waksmanii]KAJ5980882.1 FAD-binding type 2 [Penicillium waksmanii]